MTDHQRPEALRAQFEQHMLDNGWSDGELDWRGSHHAYLDIQDAWKLYQAGHAAAKAETAAAVAKEMERCIGIIESHHIPVGNSAAGEMACEWTYDALKTIRAAIRAGAKETSDG